MRKKNFYDDFQTNKSSYLWKAKQKRNNAEANWRDVHGWIYRQFHRQELNMITENIMYENYYSLENRANEIVPRYDVNKALIEGNEENNNARKNELQKIIDKTKRLID